MKTLHVDLGTRSYPIYIGAGLLNQPELMAPYIKGKTTVTVSNTTVAPLYIDKIHKQLSGFPNTDVLLPDGEEYKTFETLGQIYTEMLEARCDRKTTLITLGGGVVGDVAGYAAASYQRGINFIQVPTTLLAMVDSSVGGKTGVNHPLGKNMVGAFHQPQCVLIDTETLNTLDDRQLSAGIAEIIKYGYINDLNFIDWLEGNMDALLNRDPEALAYAIYRSCQHKADIVAADEKEKGQRALLNLGHTFGHAIENTLGYGNYLHGEAISVGMLMAVKLSQLEGYVSVDAVVQTQDLLEKSNLPISISGKITASDFMAAMSVDKKVIDGNIRLILLKELGDAFICDDYQQPLLNQVVNDFCQ